MLCAGLFFAKIKLNMNYYDLTKQARTTFRAKVAEEILISIQKNASVSDLPYISDSDTYVRKVTYEAIGDIYKSNVSLRKNVIAFINQMFKLNDQLARQTATNAMGEVGLYDPGAIGDCFDRASEDDSPKVRNAVVGSLKKIGQKHPGEVLEFAKRNVNNQNEEVRRIAMHGLELRGRTNPEEILPTLKLFQKESKARLKKMLIHVVGQSSYKKSCLETVLAELKTWDHSITIPALKEIYAVHVYYAEFSYYTSEEARQMMLLEFQDVFEPSVLKEIEDMYITPGKKVAGRDKG